MCISDCCIGHPAESSASVVTLCTRPHADADPLAQRTRPASSPHLPRPQLRDLWHAYAPTSLPPSPAFAVCLRAYHPHAYLHTPLCLPTSIPSNPPNPSDAHAHTHAHALRSSRSSSAGAAIPYPAPRRPRRKGLTLPLGAAGLSNTTGYMHQYKYQQYNTT